MTRRLLVAAAMIFAMIATPAFARSHHQNQKSVSTTSAPASAERCDFFVNPSCLSTASLPPDGGYYIRSGRKVRQQSEHQFAGLPGPLVAKAQEIEAACGSRTISTYRPGARVRGSGRPSLHGFHKAADVAGNPSCIYAHLHDWPGGYSTDYSAVRHVHISYDPAGREWGARFAHWHGGHRHHYAHRHHRTRLARG